MNMCTRFSDPRNLLGGGVTPPVSNFQLPVYCKPVVRRGWRGGDQGQAIIFVLLALGLFLLAAVGFTVDIANVWFHRQSAQNAADAACTAGIMDVLVSAQGSPTPGMGFVPGTPFDCASSSAATPCKYAALNGYDSTGLVAGAGSNDVAVSFPSTVPSPPPNPAPSSMAAVPYLRVDVVDRVRLTFASLISGNRTMDVRAHATCGLVMASVPIPAIVMNPTCPITFSLTGSSSMNIVGGPNQSVQVNSNAANAAQIGTVDFSLGGPNYMGSNFGVFGGPPPTPTGFSGGTTGGWMSPSSPISDPFYNVPPPSVPPPPGDAQDDLGFRTCAINNGQPPAITTFTCAGKGSPCTDVPGPVVVGGVQKCAGWRGCPDLNKCDEYTGGLYTSAIEVKNKTAIFDPGLYYITGTVQDQCPNMPSGACWSPNAGCRYGLALEANSMARPSTAPGDGSQGTVFYLSGTGAGTYGSVFVGSNSGKISVNPFTTSNATCSGGSPPDPRLNLPATLTGNVLLGPCTGPSGCLSGAGCTNYGSSDGKTRGMLFWNNRDNADPQGQASMQGGGQMLLAGTMYFHNCSSLDGAGLGTNCRPPMAGYNGFFQLQGNPGSSTYVLGFIVADDISLGGGAQLDMALDPDKKFNVLKATLLQ